MRLEMDCVREILLCVEENTGLRKRCRFIDESLNASQEFLGEIKAPAEYQEPLTKKYGNDTLIYHINYCIQAGLLEKAATSNGYVIVISDLTPNGHSFVENIRDNKIWAGVKGVAVKVGSKSLEAVIQIASNVITELIRSQFQLG